MGSLLAANRCCWKYDSVNLENIKLLTSCGSFSPRFCVNIFVDRDDICLSVCTDGKSTTSNLRLVCKALSEKEITSLESCLFTEVFHAHMDGTSWERTS